MEVAANRCTVDIGFNMNMNQLPISKDFISPLSYDSSNHRISHQKKFFIEVFNTLDSVFLFENLSKHVDHAYEYVLDSLNEDQKQKWGTIDNRAELCAGICFFLERKYGITVKKSSLAKILGISLSKIRIAFDILKKMKYFKDIINLPIDTEILLREFMESIPVSEIPLKQKKPPKELENKSIPIKTPFFPFLFYDFVKKLKLKNAFNSLPIGSSWYQTILYPKSEINRMIGIPAQYKHNLLKLIANQFKITSMKTINLKNLGECGIISARSKQC